MLKSSRCVSSPLEMTSHDIRLRVPRRNKVEAKWRCAQGKKQRGERWEEKVRGGQHRYLVSLLLYLSSFIAFLHCLSQSLTGFFRRVHASESDSLTRKPVIILLVRTNRRGGESRIKNFFRIHRAVVLFLSFSRSSYFVQDATATYSVYGRWLSLFKRVLYMPFLKNARVLDNLQQTNRHSKQNAEAMTR